MQLRGNQGVTEDRGTVAVTPNTLIFHGTGTGMTPTLSSLESGNGVVERSTSTWLETGTGVAKTAVTWYHLGTGTRSGDHVDFNAAQLGKKKQEDQELERSPNGEQEL